MSSINIMIRISLILALFGVILLLTSPYAVCQNWSALPPYNTLWPLWSPILSPVDITTGLPSPIVSSLETSTVLPVQPGLTWNPALPYPWLLYNTPLGMIYYDAMFGVNTWPPFSLVNTMTGGPLPITLPIDYGSLLATDPAWIYANVPTANGLYNQVYPYYAYLSTLGLSNPFLLPSITPLNIASKLTMLTLVGYVPTAVPSVVGASAILGY
ncbi:hypothetical protein JXL19_00760 [bacterium]|nr:hypothetical protein [bacterium]